MEIRPLPAQERRLSIRERVRRAMTSKRLVGTSSRPPSSPSRGAGGPPDRDAGDFHRLQIPLLLSGPNGYRAFVAAEGLGPLHLCVADQSWTYSRAGDSLVVEEGLVGTPQVAVVFDPHDWSDIASQLRTVMPLYLDGRLTITTGTIHDLGRWEVVLKALYFGKPVLDPSRLPSLEENGVSIDFLQRFTLDDDDETLRERLHRFGYLHVAGVLSRNEVDDLFGECARLTSTAQPTDPLTWWAGRPDGAKFLHRIIYVNQRSRLMAEYPNDPRLLRLVSLLGTPAKAFPDRQRGQQLLLKPAGNLGGISNLPWHHDCWYEAESITCPSITIGIQITGSTRATGRFEVVPGSQGLSVSPDLARDEMEGWPIVGIDTEPGDVTVHLHDVLHASPAPEGDGGRATLYMTYYPPHLADHVQEGEEISSMLERRRTSLE